MVNKIFNQKAPVQPLSKNTPNGGKKKAQINLIISEHYLMLV